MPADKLDIINHGIFAGHPLEAHRTVGIGPAVDADALNDIGPTMRGFDHPFVIARTGEIARPIVDADLRGDRIQADEHRIGLELNGVRYPIPPLRQKNHLGLGDRRFECRQIIALAIARGPELFDVRPRLHRRQRKNIRRNRGRHRGKVLGRIRLQNRRPLVGIGDLKAVTELLNQIIGRRPRRNLPFAGPILRDQWNILADDILEIDLRVARCLPRQQSRPAR